MTVRIKDEDIVNMTPVAKSKELEERKQNCIVFTIMGEHDALVDINGHDDKDGYPILYDTKDNKNKTVNANMLENAYAESIMGESGVLSYYVKIDGRGFLYNPRGMYTPVQSARHGNTNTGTKGIKKANSAWKFIRVNNRVFENYIMFLKTKSERFLTVGQREVI